MLKEEQDLRIAANNLILVLSMNEQFKQGLDSFDAMLSMSDYENRIFENPAAMSAYSAAKQNLHSSFEQFKETYGSSVISAAYEAFKRALGTDEFCSESGINSELTKSEAATLFNKVFQALSVNSAAYPEEADGYAIFIETVRSVLNPVETSNTIFDVCPYCDGTPARMSKAEFFGDSVDDTDGYVWACECGAYASIADDGGIIGIMGDRVLHSERRSVKRMVFDISRLVGATVFEICCWMSRLTKHSILRLQDIEFLNEEECRAVKSSFEILRKNVKETQITFPGSHKELMAFLADGGRFAAVNAYGYKTARLFVPIKVADEAVRVRFKKTVQDIMLPRELDYHFTGSTFTVRHPTGKSEKFKLYSKKQRMLMYKEEPKDV